MSDWRTRLQPVLAEEESAVRGLIAEENADAREAVDVEGDEWVRRRLPVRRVEARSAVRMRMAGVTSESEVAADEDVVAEPGWWEGIPAVRQLLLDGLDLGSATVLLGENGSGKSTIVEAIAMAYGLAAEGGSTGSQHRTRATESGLSEQLALVRNGLGGRAGYFLRAETMHSFFSYLEANPTNGPEPRFHELSHGESFVALVEDKFTAKRPGLYVLDEPESALSFENQLRLMRHLQTLMATGRHQILLATHSPILAALPGASILQLDHRGFREVEHDDATLVRQWRDFMLDPARFLD